MEEREYSQNIKNRSITNFTKHIWPTTPISEKKEQSPGENYLPKGNK